MTTDSFYPYLVVSDVHFHCWDFGSHTTTDGVNSRLQETIDAFKEAALALKARGGKNIMITGDLFHTRGEIKPTVYNPVHDFFQWLSDEGFHIHAIPGNHDLETEETTPEGNCFTSFGEIENFYVYNSPIVLASDNELFVFIPWTENVDQAILNLAKSASFTPEFRTNVFCHIGLSGAVPGISKATDPSKFATIERLKYVFSGHFHNHKCFTFGDGATESRVYSVGALTHQSFKDVGSLAGYLIVTKEGVEHFETSAPKFVDYSDFDSASFNPKKFQHNYVRMNGSDDYTYEEIAAIKATLESIGCQSVINRMTPIDGASGKINDPAAYTLSIRPDLSQQFKDYVRTKYEKIMAERMIHMFEKDGLDEC